MNTEVLRLNQWLLDTLATDEVPGYEVDRRTVSLLQQLQLAVTGGDQLLRQLIEHMRARRAECAAERSRLAAVQSRLGMQPEQLSAGSRRALDSAARLAQQLGLQHPSPAGLLLEHSRLSRELVELRALCAAEQASVQRNQAAVTRLLRDEADLTRRQSEAAVQQGADTARLQQELTKSRFLSEKVRQYGSEVRRQEAALQRRGFSEELAHHLLARRHQFVLEKRAGLAQLQQQLDAFCQLPASAELARVQLAQLELQLEQLETEFSRRLQAAQ